MFTYNFVSACSDSIAASMLELKIERRDRCDRTTLDDHRLQRPLFHYKTVYAIQKHELTINTLPHELHLTFDMIPRQFY